MTSHFGSILILRFSIDLSTLSPPDRQEYSESNSIWRDWLIPLKDPIKNINWIYNNIFHTHENQYENGPYIGSPKTRFEFSRKIFDKKFVKILLIWKLLYHTLYLIQTLKKLKTNDYKRIVNKGLYNGKILFGHHLCSLIPLNTPP